MPAGRKEKFETIRENISPLNNAATVIRKGSKGHERFKELKGNIEKENRSTTPDLGPAAKGKITRTVASHGAARRLGTELGTGQNIFGGDYDRTKYAKE